MKSNLSFIVAVSLLTLAGPGLAAPWVQTTSLPNGYSDHCLVYASGFLYQTGGQSLTEGGDEGTKVFYSQVFSNGIIGAWNKATPLPEAEAETALTTKLEPSKTPCPNVTNYETNYETNKLPLSGCDCAAGGMRHP